MAKPILRRASFRISRELLATLGVIVALILILLSLPLIALLKQEYQPPELGVRPFPVSVNPLTKTIAEDPVVEAMLSGSKFTGATAYAGDTVDALAAEIAQLPLYNLLASVGAPHFIVIDPGYRREEVARAFGSALAWDAEEQKAFFETRADTHPQIAEGTFSPGVYLVHANATEEEVHAIVDGRFERQVLSRYATTTEDVVPLKDALTLASIIQRETADREEMRIISGILWNRMFDGMRLQVDATLQYVKANAKKGAIKDWWPTVVPKDKFISSPYNTYLNPGLPPGPISNPSVAAVIAALNPKKTDCYFYFHDRNGGFHCSETYEGHVKLLKKHFGRGK